MSCFNDLNTIPIDEDVSTAAQVYENPETYFQVLAKLYAGLAVTGQEGPAGNGDIEGIDEGFGQYLRMLWYHQELPTEEAVIGWNDQTIKDFHDQDWIGNDGFIFAMYSRIYYQIPLCNEFLRETTTEKLSERGHQDLQGAIDIYRAEARFLRALSYWHALDLFRNVPFVTEEDIVGQFFPEQISATDLFDYLETELLDIETKITPARSNDYARADQGAVWALLAKLYLNAEVYTGQAKWSECISYCDKLISAGYTLDEEYGHLFLADNHLSNEIIFPIAFDGIGTRTWGGMTFIIRAGIGGNMDPFASGVNGGWGGSRTTRQLVDKFGDLGGVLVESSNGNTASYGQIYVTGNYQETESISFESSLTSQLNDNVFEGHKYFSEADLGFVVRTIPALNGPFLGDNNGDGILDNFGGDITVPEAGLYYVKIDLNSNTYILEKRDFGIIGDITGGQNEFQWDETDRVLKAIAVVSDGEIQFTDGVNVTLGDADGDAILSQDESISVPAGEYVFVLDLNRPDYTYSITSNSFDTRPFFFSDGQTLDIADITQFTNGYAVNKFKNITSSGEPGSDTDFPDTDFPVFRLADIYLMAAEATIRSGGDQNQAANYFNMVRTRAYKSAGGNVSPGDLDLDLILDERARELYWECHRRTDLVRFGQFTDGEYLWQWKGGVFEGAQVPAFRNVYPIPSSDVAANPNLIQNEGY